MNDWTVTTLKQHYDELHRRDREALKIQAAEYERRLDALNHEHARIAAAQKTYVSYSVLATIVSMIIAASAIWWRP